VGVIDLRSDTVTKPTPEMRHAMVNSPLGDDVFGDDPMVKKLEEMSMERMGKEAAVFVASGTMGNVLGVAVNAQHGQELIADADSHVYIYEGAGSAAISGVQVHPVATTRGVMSPKHIPAAANPKDDYHYALTAAVSFEDTQNRHGGVVWPIEDLRAAYKAAHELGLRVHLDGARVFNAAVAQGIDVAEIAACCDTLTFCLSKGLGCPAGSVFLGSKDAVDEARRWRKRLGGGMRQAGVLAAAGVVALETMVDRLAEDHANARTLADGLAELPGITCDLSRVETNLVYFDLKKMTGLEFEDECRKLDLLGGATAEHTVRFVTHEGITSQDIQSALKVCSDIVS